MGFKIQKSWLGQKKTEFPAIKNQNVSIFMKLEGNKKAKCVPVYGSGHKKAKLVPIYYPEVGTTGVQII